jgi:hypothetical protein
MVWSRVRFSVAAREDVGSSPIRCCRQSRDLHIEVTGSSTRQSTKGSDTGSRPVLVAQEAEHFLFNYEPFQVYGTRLVGVTVPAPGLRTSHGVFFILATQVASAVVFNGYQFRRRVPPTEDATGVGPESRSEACHAPHSCIFR